MAAWALVLLMAEVAGPPAPDAVPPAPGRCDRDSDAITVCARSHHAPDQRLPGLPERPPEPLLPPAETPIFGGAATLRGYVQQSAVGGFTSNRVMVGIKLPF